MHRHGDAGIGCATSAPPEVNADAQLDAMVQRAQPYKADAAKAPDSPSPERKAELQQLASDARARQAGTGRNDIRVTDKRVTTARRADDGGGDTGNSRIAPSTGSPATRSASSRSPNARPTRETKAT
ncbi:hypothetical protein J2X06_002514 [Lysobacter niastensis]|uniref:Uncharacterized protein n=1 Tax=Lysobacter niastensis TaxID=380629 RepID=A0ABU1WCJ2_9GAMM|nr:hypothetical protein [Lysobacter niastensis]MDR7135305.1 hypothetical protein [Lysobacter niastensis]